MICCDTYSFIFSHSLLCTKTSVNITFRKHTYIYRFLLELSPRNETLNEKRDFLFPVFFSEESLLFFPF